MSVTDLQGIHHVTAIASDAQRNLDFYVGLLGLRLVKRTVNFDDPQSYHFYYGNDTGAPGTILTFFAWPGARRGVLGTGQITVTSMAVPTGALPYWAARLQAAGVDTELLDAPDGGGLRFSDPDGLLLEVAASREAPEEGAFRDGAIPLEFAIRGVQGVTATLEGYERTGSLLSGTLGFRNTRSEGSRYRYEVSGGGPGATLDLETHPGGRAGQVAAGSVHHVAWRVPSDEVQLAWRTKLVAAGLNVSPVMERDYFRSIYFREPGGVLFEIATDVPGFAIDEPLDSLGMRLCLPAWLESSRERIEALLPSITIPPRNT